MRTTIIKTVTSIILTFCGFSAAMAQETLVFDHPLLFRFSDELAKIPTGRPDCLTNGIKKFETIFIEQKSGLCDSAYLILEDYAAYCINTVDFDLKLALSSSGSAGVKYRKNLEKNYFIIKGSDSALRVEANLSAIQNRLRHYLTPASLVFLQAVERETDEEPNTENLTPLQLAQRACFWDNYLKQYPQSLYWEEVYETRDTYLDALIFGSEKFPVFENGVLNTAYRRVFEKLSQEYSNGQSDSKTREVVHTFYEILQKSDLKESPEILMFTF